MPNPARRFRPRPIESSKSRCSRRFVPTKEPRFPRRRLRVRAARLNRSALAESFRPSRQIQKELPRRKRPFQKLPGARWRVPDGFAAEPFSALFPSRSRNRERRSRLLIFQARRVFSARQRNLPSCWTCDFISSYLVCKSVNSIIVGVVRYEIRRPLAGYRHKSEDGKK